MHQQILVQGWIEKYSPLRRNDLSSGRYYPCPAAAAVASHSVDLPAFEVPGAGVEPLVSPSSGMTVAHVDSNLSEEAVPPDTMEHGQVALKIRQLWD